MCLAGSPPNQTSCVCTAAHAVSTSPSHSCPGLPRSPHDVASLSKLFLRAEGFWCCHEPLIVRTPKPPRPAAMSCIAAPTRQQLLPGNVNEGQESLCGYLWGQRASGYCQVLSKAASCAWQAWGIHDPAGPHKASPSRLLPSLSKGQSSGWLALMCL